MSNEFTYKYFEDAKWVKIFAHDYSQKTKFTKQEALHCVDQSDKYSILYSLNPRDKIKEFGSYYFEFLYEFVNLTSLSISFVRFIQSNNPLEQPEVIQGSNRVPGFKIISSNFHDDVFGGLAQTTKDFNGCIPSLLNGNINSIEWYYTIGMFDECQGTNWNYNFLPSSYFSKTNAAFLWMRVMKQLTCHKSFHLRFQILVYLLSYLNK